MDGGYTSPNNRKWEQRYHNGYSFLKLGITTLLRLLSRSGANPRPNFIFVWRKNNKGIFALPTLGNAFTIDWHSPFDTYTRISLAGMLYWTFGWVVFVRLHVMALLREVLQIKAE